MRERTVQRTRATSRPMWLDASDEPWLLFGVLVGIYIAIAGVALVAGNEEIFVISVLVGAVHWLFNLLYMVVTAFIDGNIGWGLGIIVTLVIGLSLLIQLAYVYGPNEWKRLRYSYAANFAGLALTFGLAFLS